MKTQKELNRQYRTLLLRQYNNVRGLILHHELHIYELKYAALQNLVGETVWLCQDVTTWVGKLSYNKKTFRYTVKGKQFKESQVKEFEFTADSKRLGSLWLHTEPKP